MSDSAATSDFNGPERPGDTSSGGKPWPDGASAARTWLDDFEDLLMAASAKTTEELVRGTDAIDGPLRIAYEPREQMPLQANSGQFAGKHGRIAVKSGIYTLFTLGDYFDGALDGLADRLELICRAVNEMEGIPND